MIIFDEIANTFHLKNDLISCVLSLHENELMMSYLGAAIDNPPVYHWNDPHDSFDLPNDRRPYACPTDGNGDYRPAMVRVRDANGQRSTMLRYVAHRIVAGKPSLEGLPATYAYKDEEACTLQIDLMDAHSMLMVTLSYTIIDGFAAIVQNACYHNTGETPLKLENAASFCLHLPGRYDLMHLHGAWARECAIERIPPATLTRVIDSSRGASGHEHNPFVALLQAHTTEFHGECYGVNLVYSGDFKICVDENAYDSTRIVAGLNPRTFEWNLGAGESFQAPEAVCVYSCHGINDMSQTFHRLYRTRLCKGYWRDRVRPVLINNWEATYYDFNHEQIMNIARSAADAGVELFVLDDGWFGKRDNDNSSLGDWTANKGKLPNGLEALAKEIVDLGIGFGLWVEPEMVSPDSQLYRSHPDWCLHAQDRSRTQARNQLVLDMSRTEVQDYVIDAISVLLKNAPISYIKWDMNRNFTQVGSAALASMQQGEVSHRYMLGLYRVLSVITDAFPKVLFESCSGGGGRFDAGMLYYMPQTWTSDNTDAVARLRIQHGTSLCYPICAIGAHVSAVPNHQTQRNTSLEMRGHVAITGNFGYELDLSAQTAADLDQIRQQITLVKSLRETTQRGIFTRLLSPYEGNITAWQFHDEKRVILCCYQTLAQPNPAPFTIRLHGLALDAKYRCQDGDIVSGDQLMHAGIRCTFPQGDFVSRLIVYDRL